MYFIFSTYNKNLDFVLEQLEQQSSIALKWFENNYKKTNSGKYHLFLSGNKCKHLWAKIGDNTIWKSRTTKLLDITTDTMN